MVKNELSEEENQLVELIFRIPVKKRLAFCCAWFTNKDRLFDGVAPLDLLKLHGHRNHA